MSQQTTANSFRSSKSSLLDVPQADKKMAQQNLEYQAPLQWHQGPENSSLYSSSIHSDSASVHTRSSHTTYPNAGSADPTAYPSSIPTLGPMPMELEMKHYSHQKTASIRDTLAGAGKMLFGRHPKRQNEPNSKHVETQRWKNQERARDQRATSLHERGKNLEADSANHDMRRWSAQMNSAAPGVSASYQFGDGYRNPLYPRSSADIYSDRSKRNSNLSISASVYKNTEIDHAQNLSPHENQPADLLLKSNNNIVYANHRYHTPKISADSASSPALSGNRRKCNYTHSSDGLSPLANRTPKLKAIVSIIRFL